MRAGKAAARGSPEDAHQKRTAKRATAFTAVALSSLRAGFDQRAFSSSASITIEGVSSSGRTVTFPEGL